MSKKGKGFVAEFKKFIMRGNVIDLAVGVIIGGAFQAIVNSLVNDIVMPLLGSITGGMTSTPALGTLISVAGTEDVAAAYAATYPIALICIVLASKLIIMFC